MRSVVIEWMHLDKDGNTCERCSNTGYEVKEVVSQLNDECRSSGIRIDLVETKLPESEIDKSNLILVNGVAIESLLSNAQASRSSCSSCGELTGNEELCRTIVQFGSVYETIPQQLIRKTVCQVTQCC